MSKKITKGFIILLAFSVLFVAARILASKAPTVVPEPQKVDYLTPGQFIVPDASYDPRTSSLVATGVSIPKDTTLERIAWCESRNIATAKNPNSTAKGRFQFLDSTWRHYAQQKWGDKWQEYDVYNYDHNTELATYVYIKNGTKDWEADPASHNCWRKIAEDA